MFLSTLSSVRGLALISTVRLPGNSVRSVVTNAGSVGARQPSERGQRDPHMSVAFHRLGTQKDTMPDVIRGLIRAERVHGEEWNSVCSGNGFCSRGEAD